MERPRPVPCAHNDGTDSNALNHSRRVFHLNDISDFYESLESETAFLIIYGKLPPTYAERLRFSAVSRAPGSGLP